MTRKMHARSLPEFVTIAARLGLEIAGKGGASDALGVRLRDSGPMMKAQDRQK